jgi:hypothetical protein
MKNSNKYKDEFERLENLRSIVVAQRIEFLRQFTHEELLIYASNKDIQRLLFDIYTKKTRSIAPDKGGMKTNPRTLFSKKNVPLAILRIHGRREKVTSDSIKDELDKLPDSRDEKGRVIYTENSIKIALASYNKDTERWLIDNKQLEDI